MSITRLDWGQWCNWHDLPHPCLHILMFFKDHRNIKAQPPIQCLQRGKARFWRQHLIPFSYPFTSVHSVYIMRTGKNNLPTRVMWCVISADMCYEMVLDYYFWLCGDRIFQHLLGKGKKVGGGGGPLNHFEYCRAWYTDGWRQGSQSCKL